jgi:AhpD family alkylhydroperoxidase
MTSATMEPRIEHPVLADHDAMKAMQTLSKVAGRGGLPAETAYLVHLRASQINGCSVCVEMHSRELRESGSSEERIATVAAWREAPYFSDAERAALALTEAGTRIADRPDPVSDQIWDEAAAHFNEQQLQALVVDIVAINAWNRFNCITRQVAGRWGG